MIEYKTIEMDLMLMDDYEVEIVNPEAFEQNKISQQRLAKWLLEFGLRIGTIHDPRVPEKRSA